MEGLLLISLLAAVSTAVSGQITSAHVGTFGGSSNFQGQGAALSENVGPDGSRQGECAYADSNGQQIKVRYHQQQGREAQYHLIKGSPGTNPAAAYEQCLKQHRASQQAGAAFIPGFNPFNPFAGGAFDVGSPAIAAQAFAGGFVGAVAPGSQQAAAGGVRHDHAQVGAAAHVDSGALFPGGTDGGAAKAEPAAQQNVFEMCSNATLNCTTVP